MRGLRSSWTPWIIVAVILILLIATKGQFAHWVHDVLTGKRP